MEARAASQSGNRRSRIPLTLHMGYSLSRPRERMRLDHASRRLSQLGSWPGRSTLSEAAASIGDLPSLRVTEGSLAVPMVDCDELVTFPG
jgi:hypothetical protein